jgi:hypothetical protein
VLNATLQELSEIRKQRVYYESASPEILDMDSKQRRTRINTLKELDIETVANIRALDKQLRDLSK